MTLAEFINEQNEAKKRLFAQKVRLYIDLTPKNLAALGVNRNTLYLLSILSAKKDFVSFSGETECKILISNALSSGDAKIRKHAYVIIGNLHGKRFASELEKSANTENTYYNYPSLMLALISCGKKEKAKELYLKSKTIFDGGDMPQKHFSEIENAYALLSPVKTEKLKISAICKDYRFLFTTQKCYRDLFIKSAFKNLKCEKTEDGVITQGLTFEEFCLSISRHDYYDAYIIIGKEKTPEKAFELGCMFLKDFIKKQNLNKIGFRTEVSSGYKDKEKIIKLAKRASDEYIVNSPSDYSVTLCFDKDKDYDCKLRLDSLYKDRFLYRKKSLPASINPVTANIICRYALSFNPHANTVADLFCGSATILVEYNSLCPTATLYGFDINQTAIDIARENTKCASVKVNLTRKNALLSSLKADAVISNLPYGLRVGSHADNLQLYQKLCLKLSENLNENGYAFLYTADKQLLLNCIKKAGLTLISTIPMESGGLYCSLFIIRKS